MRVHMWAMTARSWLTISMVRPWLAAYALQQVEDFRLHREIERGGRLVEEQDARLHDQRPRDGDALALAARDLVGIAIAVLAAPMPTSRSARSMRRSTSSSPWMASGSERILSTVWAGLSEP